jgi:hypothetical protein
LDWRTTASLKARDGQEIGGSAPCTSPQPPQRLREGDALYVYENASTKYVCERWSPFHCDRSRKLASGRSKPPTEMLLTRTPRTGSVGTIPRYLTHRARSVRKKQRAGGLSPGPDCDKTVTNLLFGVAPAPARVAGIELVGAVQTQLDVLPVRLRYAAGAVGPTAVQRCSRVVVQPVEDADRVRMSRATGGLAASSYLTTKGGASSCTDKCERAHGSRDGCLPKHCLSSSVTWIQSGVRAWAICLSSEPQEPRQLVLQG